MRTHKQLKFVSTEHETSMPISGVRYSVRNSEYCSIFRGKSIQVSDYGDWSHVGITRWSGTWEATLFITPKDVNKYAHVLIEEEQLQNQRYVTTGLIHAIWQGRWEQKYYSIEDCMFLGML